MKQGLIAVFTMMALSGAAIADDSVDHSSKASKHSVLAGLGSAEVSASVASAVAVVPVVLIVGSVVMANESLQSAHTAIEGRPVKLAVTEKVITADPAPAVVINQTVINPEKLP